ncbi:hypothetical protein BDN70DRAFT_906293 [Pholiota conissans]|uniref:BRCA2 OB1 domain-containing protein n=1 Tax=Pholiota conissans TaxID=109636 RepID=A0A9P5Z116_9AGAR|nr:hypothetical protein BDN70DRAFT_906293 [Pholiota conissans]
MWLRSDIATLSQITPDTAPYYNFHRTSSSPPPSSSSVPVKALEKGCDLATRPWVDNHWSLILWKLAAMVAFDPEKESKPDEARWCWSTVMRQLLYRYERELNEGIRPPLRKIANQDAPPAFPMVLCVTNIFWSARREDEDENPIEPHPELELTDGWYRLRAQIDLPMARAVRRGVIKIGRKIGFAGARLLTEKKDAMEILDAYSSTFLVISGNSSHLMPWHTKLGFTQGPCISTLHSLTADGGVVAALDFVIVKAHPIAYLEFIQHEDGKRETIGPRNEAEEMQVNESWKKQREIEASKLRAEYEKKIARYEGYIDRLERKAGGNLESIRGSDNYPPDHIDSLYDELEYPDTAATLMARISPNDAAWLSLHVRKENEKGRESVGEEIEKELQSICPARQVRSFRVLIIQDARTLRRPANRKAQLTIWDVTNITFDEGDKAGAFEAGQRFMATNLNPQQPKAWMDCSPGSEVFLSTRRDTRWTKIKTIAATT